jgi:predicted phage terminase large subunit-like protein
MALSPEARGLLLANPDLFLTKYFSHRLRHKLEHFHLDLIETSTRATKSLILFPAAHGKTTIISTLLPIWAFCRDPDIRMANILKNEDEASKVMQAIHAECLGNDELVRDFGPFYDKERTWAMGAITVAKRTIIAKEPTLAVFGSGARTALGHRTDWTICDDIITDKNSATPEQRSKIREWFNLGPMTMAEDIDDRLTVIGTMFHPEDLYHDLLELRSPETGELIWETRKYDAITDEEAHKTLWEARWPWARLMEQKAGTGTLDFNKRYRNFAVDPSRMLFKEEYVKGGYIGKEKYPGCLDGGYRVGDYDPSWRRVAAIDPAVGVSRHAKFSAHLVLATGSCKEHERCYWIVDLTRDQFTLPRLVDLVIQEHEQYDLLKSIVEVNSFQAGLEQAIQQKLSDQGLALTIEPHHTTRTNKPDPELGVQALVPWFENGQVHIPWADAASRRKMTQLVDELVQYPGRTTDTVMSLWMAWRALQQTAPKYKSFNRLHKPTPTWLGKRISRNAVQNPYYARRQDADEVAAMAFHDDRHEG